MVFRELIHHVELYINFYLHPNYIIFNLRYYRVSKIHLLPTGEPSRGGGERGPGPGESPLLPPYRGELACQPVVEWRYAHRPFFGQYPPPSTNNLHAFLLRGSERSPAFLPLLLLLSGDIETNPGPTYPCPTCTRPYSRRLGAIECTRCGSWTHYTLRCSGIPQRHHIPPHWLCRSCHPSHNILIPDTP